MPRTVGQLWKRTAAALRRRANWSQLARFALVGASGYVINLVVFSALVGARQTHYLPAAAFAFCIAVSNNFLLNRYWTFKATRVTAALQAPRFLAVSLGALALNLAALEVLISVAGLPATVAQAIAIGLATPISFAGNKLWSFSTPAELST
jgi:putative flippase GtrA